MGVLGTTIGALAGAGAGAIFATVRTDQNAKYLGSDWRQRLEQLCKLDKVKPTNIRQLRFSVTTRKGNQYFDRFDVNILNILYIEKLKQKLADDKKKTTDSDIKQLVRTLPKNLNETDDGSSSQPEFKPFFKWLNPIYLPEDMVKTHTGYFDQLVINFCDASLSAKKADWWSNDGTLKEAYAAIFRQFVALLLKAQWVVLDQKGKIRYQMLKPRRGGDDALLEGYWIIKENIPQELDDLMGNIGKTEERTKKGRNGYIDLTEVAPVSWMERRTVRLYSLLILFVLPVLTWMVTLLLNWAFFKISPKMTILIVAIAFLLAWPVAFLYRHLLILKCNDYEDQRHTWKKTEETIN